MTTTTKTVTSFEFQDYGVDHAQYFPGVGTAFTDWDEVFLGCGDTAHEAATDALEQVDSYDTGPFDDMYAEAQQFDDTVSAHAQCFPCEEHAGSIEDDESEAEPCDCHDECELHHYVALFVRYQEA